MMSVYVAQLSTRSSSFESVRARCLASGETLSLAGLSRISREVGTLDGRSLPSLLSPRASHPRARVDPVSEPCAARVCAVCVR